MINEGIHTIETNKLEKEIFIKNKVLVLIQGQLVIKKWNLDVNYNIDK